MFMDVSKEIITLCKALNLNETELAKELGVTFETVNFWKNNKKTIDLSNLEKLYSYSYSKGIRFNNIYEQFFKEDYSNDGNIVLFYGAKKSFSLPLDFTNNSKATNDFGVGFYLGETFEQAANYISFLDASFVYCFKLELKDLKTYKFVVNTEWMIAIAYFRGWIRDYKNSFLIKNILEKISDCDVIIAPIADNRMFDIIADFVEGNITDEVCKHSLAATNLGFQYVLKTDKAISKATMIKEMFVSKKEKEECVKNRIMFTENGLEKVKIARIEYKDKGKYFKEIVK